ncbi:hypothetical protein GLOIN_2v618094 [Rhizophagus irregularis DAOM 181602=DAOM 197198]|uniref:Uncharacterized protein n=2 Tax=Rhizophagus irregularis TaxID=588596 RepID=A0A2P4QYR6_RHIID|nr:hypothetical protein GLOIN_2v618094 [Rhizophagus irregularis DAOM 181602=DAOM 197198]POG82794.1 hypothetical protein GLOIN_2v618094 [Rhizophagus irregularis DAOM 181602=DAOM 197198]|eukprot:XP_025189660.1 hypothetical protein GLOIN_2v618094 [Rhizophagus irregularis DAOM 181602=DAOM 197198]
MIEDETIVENPFDLLRYVTWPNVLLCLIVIMMIKGVREESGCIMLLFYIASFILYGFYVYISIDAIKVLTSQDYLDNPGYILEKKIDLIVNIISFCITTITMINSIICHKNFGAEKKFKDHLLNDELKHFKESYYYKDDIDEYYNSNNP